MKSFNEWLVERDPEMSEAMGLRTMGRAARWMGRKGLPFAVQAGMTLADPISLAAPPKPFMGHIPAPSPNRDAGSNVDDWLTMKADRERQEREKVAKIAARRKANMGPPIPV